MEILPEVVVDDGSDDEGSTMIRARINKFVGGKKGGEIDFGRHILGGREGG